MDALVGSCNITALALVDGQGDCYNLKISLVRRSK